jgi:EmrB/QacA subfamily drug resistance transporter
MVSLRRITAEQLQQRRWELLAVTSVGAFMTPLDSSIVSVALPVMSRELHLSLSASIWVQAAYLLTTAVLLIPLGRLADHYGRVRYYLAGIAIFGLGSLLAGLSASSAWLIGSRVFQGLGGALQFATSAAIVTAVFPSRERGRALGINVMSVYSGLSVGPPLGGFIVDNLGWRWIFYVNIPIAIAVVVWGWVLLPRREREAERGAPRANAIGTALLAGFLVCLLVPLTFAPQWGWMTARSLMLLAVAAVSLALFVLEELRSRDPLLDLDLLRHNRLFAAANGAALLNYMSLYAVTFLTAIYLEVVRGRSPGLTGWLMLSQPVMQAVLSPFAGRLSDRVGSRAPATAGMFLVAAGMVVLATMPIGAGSVRVMGALAVIGVGLALFSAPNTSAVMGSAPRDHLSLASAFLQTMRVTGNALSAAVLGGIAASTLGAVGGRLLFADSAALARGGSATIHNFARGFSYAMATGAGLAFVGALLSLTRGAPQHVCEVIGKPAR